MVVHLHLGRNCRSYMQGLLALVEKEEGKNFNGNENLQFKIICVKIQIDFHFHFLMIKQ